MKSAWPIGVALLGVAVLSCATPPAVITQDYKLGTFTVCGSRQASNAELDQRAAQVCATQAPQTLRCTPDATYTQVGIQGAVPTTGNCCDYSCPPALMRQSQLSLPPSQLPPGTPVAFSQ